jgi:DNA-binding transcriptional LysR family regulator
MELRQLRYFVAIVDHGSLSRAALVLHVAQPALTQQLRQLEDELGVQLLHRSAQGVLSTDAGKIFYEHAQAILKQVADAQAAVIQSAERPSGSVTLGLPHSISGALALPLLTAIAPALSRNHPAADRGTDRQPGRAAANRAASTWPCCSTTASWRLRHHAAGRGRAALHLPRRRALGRRDATA